MTTILVTSLIDGRSLLMYNFVMLISCVCLTVFIPTGLRTGMRIVPTTDVPVRDVSSILPLFNHLLQSRLFPAVSLLFKIAMESLRIVDAFVVKYNASKQRSLPVHCDQSQFSFTGVCNIYV